MRIDVLNETGRDAPVDYRSGVGAPDARVHPPVNYWAFAACTAGRFYQHLSEVEAGADAIIVLLRQRNGAAIKAVQALKQQGRRVFISWKETGLHQLAQQTRWPWQRSALKKIHALADGAVAVTEGSVEFYRRFGGGHYPVHFIPTPYPVDCPAWDFSVPAGQRKGIFIGTRQFDVPARRHGEALALAAVVAKKLDCRVTVLNTDGAAARKKTRQLLAGVNQLNLVEQRLSYPDYLRLMAGHRLVLQRDASNVPGQVAGDALLSRLVNVGGDGTVQRLAFPQYSRINDDDALAAVVEKLLADDGAYAEAVDLSQQRAQQALSYRAGRDKLKVLLS